MLHEILLSLSGHPSPLLLNPHSLDKHDSDQTKFPLLSPPERALLTTIADLSNLHVQLRQQLAQITSSHPSIICRAVATHISSENLRDFQDKILEFEKAILAKDAGYVGGYAIVPLSTIVGEFAPWTRRMEWLSEVAGLVLSTNKGAGQDSGKACSGPQLIGFLRDATRTGYEDLEKMAIRMVQTAEMAWLRQLSTWLLYGKLPSFSSHDLFIQQEIEYHSEPDFKLSPDLLPSFVSTRTAASALFIGRSLRQIKSRDSRNGNIATRIDAVAFLFPIHLELLGGLKSPITSSEMSQTISKIRLSMSQNALAQMLPLQTVIETVDLLQRFLLLGQGEFAVSLITRADQRVQERSRDASSHLPVRKAGRLDGLTIREGELKATLGQSWADLASYQNDEDSFDEELEKARDLVRLSVLDSEGLKADNTSDEQPEFFDDLLFPTRTALSLTIASPLDLFLSPSSVRKYSMISSYLISIRRAELHLSSLWKTTGLRRCHPTPAGPPFSASTYGHNKLTERRHRDSKRSLKLRPFWATANAALFFTSELGVYLHGSVIAEHSVEFRLWLGSFSSPLTLRAASNQVSPSSRDPETASTSKMPHTRPAPASSIAQANPILDPATLSHSHSQYLNALLHCIFLTSPTITKPLHTLLRDLEHFIALFNRLATVHSNMDLEAEGVEVGDALADYEKEEHEVFEEMERTSEGILNGMKAIAVGVVAWEERPEDLNKGAGPTSDDEDDELETMDGGFMSWSKNNTAVSKTGVEALVIKLDFLIRDQRERPGDGSDEEDEAV